LRKIPLVLLLLAISLVSDGPSRTVSAEETKAREPGVISLEPIAVTASRTERRLSEVPASISIISRKRIEDSNAKDISDLLKDTEGVYAYDPSGVGTAGRVNMRGFWGGMSSQQLVLLDGVPQNAAEDRLVDWDRIPLENIEKIEVLRGPASALYGDNAMSGVINIITRKPATDPKTAASLSYGSFNTQNYNTHTSGHMGNAGYYFTAGRKLTDGFRRYSDYNSVYCGSKLNFSFNNAPDFSFFADYYDKAYGPYPWAITEAQIEDDRRQARPGCEEDKTEAKSFNAGTTCRMTISEISDAAATFYYRYEDSKSFYTRGSTGSSTREQLEEEDTYGILFRHNIKPELFGMQHSITSGVDVEANDFDYNRYSAPFQVRGDKNQDYTIERHKIGPYIQSEISVLEPLKIVAGVRYDWIRFDFNNHLDQLNSKKTEMSGISPSCGITINYHMNSNFYANYGKAFRSPAIGQMFTYGSASNPDLDPEEAENYEFGIRHWFNKYLKANAQVYWMDLDNEIWYDNEALQYKNYGKTSHKGLETGLSFMITKKLSGFFNYAYTHATNSSGDNKGKYLTSVPIHKWGAGLSGQTDFGLKATVLITGIGRSYIDAPNNERVAGYATVDAKLSYEREWLTLSLAFDNLLDKKYNSSGYKSGNGLNYFTPAPGRMFTISTKVKF